MSVSFRSDERECLARRILLDEGRRAEAWQHGNGRIVDSAIQLTGGAAVVEDHPLERLYRRIRSWRIAEGTTEMLRLVIARGLLTRRRGQRFGERR
jgi:hypothetical protein